MINKCDLLPLASQTSSETAAALQTSARAGSGIDELGREIVRRLIPRSPPPGQAVPFTSQQIEILEAVRSELLADRIVQASRLVSGFLAGVGSLKE